MTTAVRLTGRRARTHAAPAKPDWDYALCAQTDPELFFPDGVGGAVHYQTVSAKKICAQCPLQPSCLAWALDTGQSHGVWGGATEDERRAMLRRVSSGLPPVDDRPRWQVIVETRADEFRAADSGGRTAWQVGRALKVDAPTVHRVREALAGQEADAR